MEHVAEHLRANSYTWSMETPVEETDPIRAHDGTLWKNWRHTGAVQVLLNGKYYTAYQKHDLAAAKEIVIQAIAADLGII